MTNIKQRIGKVLLILLVLQFVFAIVNVSEATTWGDIFGSADSFLKKGKDGAAKGEITTGTGNNTATIGLPDDGKLNSIVSDIYNILFPLGVAITVIIGGALGIKFMMASAEDKAKVKESLVPYVVGCVVIYGAFGIWKLAITIFSGLS